MCSSIASRDHKYVINISPIFVIVLRGPGDVAPMSSTPILVHRPLAVRRAAVARDLVVLDGKLVVVHDLFSRFYIFERDDDDLACMRAYFHRLRVGVWRTAVVDESTHQAAKDPRGHGRPVR